MRKRKTPIGAVFFLVLLISIVAFLNMQGGTAGVRNPEMEQHQMDQQQAAQGQQPPSNDAPQNSGQQPMQGQGQGPLSPNGQGQAPPPQPR